MQDGTGPRTIKKSRCALESVNANRTATRPFDRRGVARSRFVRVETAGCTLRVEPARDLVEVGVPVLPPDCEAGPAAGAEGVGDEGAGAVAGRVGVVTIGGATGVGVDEVVTRGGAVVTVTGAGGSAVVTGSGGGGGRAVVTGGSAVVTGSEGVVTVTPGTGGSSRASACAAMSPARAAARPKRLPKRDIPNLQRATPANGCGRATYSGVLSSSATELGAGTGSAAWSWPCSSSCE